jgi:hypothetical protein
MIKQVHFRPVIVKGGQKKNNNKITNLASGEFFAD